MTYAVKEFATVPLSDDPARAAKQLTHLVGLIGDEKVFMIVFKLPERDDNSPYVEPDDNFVQTTGTQAGLTVELMRDRKLFTLGHQGEIGQQVTLTRKDGTAVEVNQNEVLSPQEVGQLLIEYVETNSINTSGWSLREIPLAKETSELEVRVTDAGPSRGHSERAPIDVREGQAAPTQPRAGRGQPKKSS